MKIVVTGSLGNISKPLTKELVQKGNQVSVITSKQDKKKDIEALKLYFNLPLKNAEEKA